MKILIVEDETAVAMMMVYLLTSAGSKDNWRPALELGVMGCIVKPFEVTDFISRSLSRAKRTVATA